METEQSVIWEIHSTLAESSLTLQQKVLHLHPEVSEGRQGQGRLRQLLQYLVKFFFLFQLGSKYKATDLDEANTNRVTWEKCVKKQGMVGVACFSSQYTRQGDLEFKANLRYIGTGPRNPHHDPVFKPCFRNRKPKGLKSNRGMAAYTCVWEPWEERFSEEDHFSSGVWGHSGQHRELFTYNTIQQQQKQENQYLYW